MEDKTIGKFIFETAGCVVEIVGRMWKAARGTARHIVSRLCSSIACGTLMQIPVRWVETAKTVEIFPLLAAFDRFCFHSHGVNVPRGTSEMKALYVPRGTLNSLSR